MGGQRSSPDFGMDYMNLMGREEGGLAPDLPEGEDRNRVHERRGKGKADVSLLPLKCL